MKHEMFYKWIIDESAKYPLGTLSNFETIKTFIKKNKLQAYALGRLKTLDMKNSFKILENLYIEFENDQKKAIQRHEKEFDFLLKLAEEFSEPIILIKGDVPYLLSEKRIPLRDSSDIDLLCSKPSDLRNKLMRDFFVEKKGETGHELSKLVKDELKIDLQKYIPVYRYPSDLINVTKTGEQTSESFILAAQITYSDLIRNCERVFKNIFVPNATLSVLILCTNLFRDYVNNLTKIPMIKIAHLVEIKELLKENSFDISLFNKLVKEFNADQAVSLIGILLKDLFKTSQLDKYIDRSLENFPQTLFWNFNSWYLPTLSVSKRIFTENFDQTLLHFHATKFEVTNNDLQIHYNRTTSNYQIYSNSYKGEDLRFSVTVKWGNTFQLNIKIFDVSLHSNDIISFEFGRVRSTYFGCVERETQLGGKRQLQGSDNIIYNTNSRTISVDIEIQREQLSSFGNSIGLYLYIEKYLREDEINLVVPIIFIKKNEEN